MPPVTLLLYYYTQDHTKDMPYLPGFDGKIWPLLRLGPAPFEVCGGLEEYDEPVQ
ncbi:MAG TPA: hypothetical protein VK177_20015 [Flavobacteriales bacterium]|nr:hypothetical protein [Flavobacteriales bacterium]